MKNIATQIAEAIAQRLAVIEQDADYFTNLGQKVITEPWQVDERDLPVLAVVPGRFTRRALATTHYERQLDVMVQCAVPAGWKDANEQANNAIDDVLAALPGTFTISLATGSAEVEVQGGDVLQRPGGLQFVVAQIALQARLRERSA